MTALAPTLEAFFTQRLIHQRQASPNTIAAYRDAWRLLLGYAQGRSGKHPYQLDLGDLDAELIGDFLAHLETERHNSVRTRNARLAAIHSLFRYAALRHPEHLLDIERVLAIPPKRSDHAPVTFLDEHEINALLAAPDRGTQASAQLVTIDAVVFAAAPAVVRVFHARRLQLTINLDPEELARGDLDRFAPEPHHGPATRRRKMPSSHPYL